MLPKFLVSPALLAVSFAFFVSSAHAQTVPDDPSLRDECEKFNAAAKQLDSGAIKLPAMPALQQTSPQQLASVARASSAAGQHQSACTLYFLAGIAGSSSGANRTDVHTWFTLGGAEHKLMLGQSLTLTDRLARVADSNHPPATQNDVNQILSSLSSAAPTPGNPSSAPATPTAPPNPAAQFTGSYTPLAPSDNLASDAARHDYVFSHVSPAGTPASCNGDWSKMGTFLGACVQALHKQADAEVAAKNYTAALMDLDNAKLAALSGGSFAVELTLQSPDRQQIQDALHPQKPNPATQYGKAGQMPVGPYGCYSGLQVISPGLNGGGMVVQSPTPFGDVWILDAKRYAGPFDKSHTGTYHMSGNQFIPDTGDYASAWTKQHEKFTYVADGLYHKPTLRIDTVDDNGKPSVSFGCTIQDHD